MIEVRQLGKRFGDTWAIRGLELAIGRGEIFGLLGPNGAGKTTTLRMLAALLHPTEGQVTVGGQRLGSHDEAIRRQVGYLPGEPGLYEALSAEANLDFFARLQGMGPADRLSRVRAALELVDLGPRRADRVGTFSKGMKQRLALARALLHQPAVLLLDEPTAGLDPALARRVRELLERQRERGAAIVLSTHDLEDAQRLCDRVGLLANRLLRVDTPLGLARGLFGRRLRVRLAAAAPELPARLVELPFVQQVRELPDGLSVSLADPDGDAPALVRALVAAGTEVARLEEEVPSLEDAYLEILGSEGSAGC